MSIRKPYLFYDEKVPSEGGEDAEQNNWSVSSLIANFIGWQLTYLTQLPTTDSLDRWEITTRLYVFGIVALRSYGTQTSRFGETSLFCLGHDYTGR